MDIISRTLNGLFVLAALLLAFPGLSAEWLLGPGALQDRLDDCITLIEAQRKAAKLDGETHLTIERVQVKGAIAEALRKDEMTLIEAAAGFRALHEDPKSWHNTLSPRPELEDGEGWCRVVIEWVKNYSDLNQTHSQAVALAHRLEAQLQEHLDSYGTISLPD